MLISDFKQILHSLILNYMKNWKLQVHRNDFFYMILSKKIEFLVQCKRNLNIIQGS